MNGREKDRPVSRTWNFLILRFSYIGAALYYVRILKPTVLALPFSAEFLYRITVFHCLYV